jgi:hypothetical protein
MLMIVFILPQRTQSLTQSYTEDIYVAYTLKPYWTVGETHFSLLATEWRHNE